MTDEEAREWNGERARWLRVTTGGPTTDRTLNGDPEVLGAAAGLVWYSPCGYQRRDLFVTSAPIPRCPECQSSYWSTMPGNTSIDVARDSRPVGEGRQRQVDLLRTFEGPDATGEPVILFAGTAEDLLDRLAQARPAAVRPATEERPISLDEAGPGFLRANPDYQGEPIYETRAAVRPVEREGAGPSIDTETCHLREQDAGG